MTVSRGEALAAARKLLRTFGSAPEPRQRARAIHSELGHAEGLTPSERGEIEALGAWLLERPPISELKPRCERLLAKLR
jgi:hypothetical protein